MKGRRTMQNMQHFMSYGAWSGPAQVEQVQPAVSERPELQGRMLILDESADGKVRR